MQAELNYIFEVYRTGSFSQAARNLYLTQPTLSIAIKKVEQAIGMPLFDRSQQPLTLTEAGRIYIARIAEIRQIEENTARELDDLRHMDAGELRIGGTQYFNSYVLPDVLQDYQAQYPAVHLTLREDNANRIDQWLLDGETDINFRSAPVDEERFTSQAVCADHLLLAVPRAHVPEDAIAQGLSWQEVAAHRFLQDDCPVQALSDFHETPFLLLTESNQLRTRALAICAENGFSPQVRFCVEQLETAWHMARHGLGATFVTEFMIAEGQDDRLLYYKVPSPHAVRHFHAILRKNSYVSHKMKCFIARVQKRSPVAGAPSTDAEQHG